MLEQDPRPCPVGRRREAAQLDGPGEAKPMLQRRGDEAEVGDVDRVLDGDLQPFIRAFLLARRGEKQ